MMRSSAKRIGSVALTLAASAWLAGCNQSSESAAFDALQTAEAHREKLAGSVSLGSDAVNAAASEIAGSLQSIDAAAGSLAAEAARTRGNVELAKARAASNELNAALADVRGDGLSLLRQAGHVQQLVLQAQGLASQNPQAGINAINRVAAQARGDGGLSRYPIQGVSLPSLNAVQQQISRIEGEIAAAEQKIAELSAVRDAALSEAASFAEQVKQAGGAEKIPLVRAAADASNRAARIARDIDAESGRLATLKNDLDVATAARTTLEDGVNTLRSQAAQLGTDWKTVEGVIAQVRSLVGSGISGEGRSIAAIVATLEPKLAEVARQAESVKALYAAAASQFDQGKSVAAAALGDIGRQASEPGNLAQPAARLTADILPAVAFDLDKAYAVIESTSVNRDLATTYVQLARATAAAVAAGASLAETLTPAALMNSAREQLGAADAALLDIEGQLAGMEAATRSEKLANGVSAAATQVLYHRVTLARLAAALGLADAVSANEATLLSRAKESAIALNEKLPSLALPQELQLVIAAKDPKPIAESKKLLLDLITAGKEYRTAEVADRLAFGPELIGAEDGLRKVLSAGDNLSRAMVERFGEEAVAALTASAGGIGGLPVSSDPESLVQSGNYTIVDDNTVKVELNGVPAPLSIVRADGVWKLDVSGQFAALSAAGQSQPELVSTAFDRMAAVFDTIAADVLSGSIQTPQAVIGRLAMDLMKAMKELDKPAGEGEQPADGQPAEGMQPGLGEF